jgi:hypothetical protein
MVTYGLSGLNQPFLAEDVTIEYDAAQLELVTEPLPIDAAAYIVVDSVSPKAGELRFLGVHLGEQSMLPDRNLVKLQFRLKESASAAFAEIRIPKLLAANAEGQEYELSGSALTIKLGIDNTALLELIANADAAYAGAVEGNRIGQYPAGSKAALLEEIQLAKAVAEDDEATQADLAAAADKLNHALQAFLAKVIVKVDGDYNNDNMPSVGDLALMAKAYGRTSADADWNTVKAFDLNGDNIIDIQDLVRLARLILNW